MKSTNYLIMLLFTLLVMAGCSGSDGADTTPTSSTSTSQNQIPVDPGSYSLQLSVPSLKSGTLLSHGGTVTVRAYISYTTTDARYGVVKRHPAADGTVVNFLIVDAAGNAIQNAGTIESSKTTVNGYAEATYSSGSYAGMVKIYADVDNNLGDGGSPEDTISFEVASGAPVAITVESIAPAIINVAGTGKTNRSILTFSLTDSAGRPVPDLSSVAFTLSTPLGGGEKLSVPEARTQDGRVSVSLIGGTVSGTVGVNARYYDAQTGVTLSTEAKVTIVSGLPAAERLGMGPEYYNLAVVPRTFFQDDITVVLGDRYGNVVPDGTTVSFMSECGTIGTSDGFQPTTKRGVASASLQIYELATPNYRGVIGSTPGNPALCTIVAYTPGDEGFNDINGNNVYDEGIDVQTSDMSEPYIDANDNGVYDSGEKYIDVDGNGSFTPADGVYQSNTMIWKSTTVLMSGAQAPLNLTPSGEQAPLNLTPKIFNVVAGGSQQFSYTLGDIWGNSLVGGTTAKVTVTGGGRVSGDVDITVADFPGAEQQHSFTLTMPADTSGTTPVEVSVEVTPAGGAAGSNASSSVRESALGIGIGSYSLQLSVPTLTPGTLLSHGGQVPVKAYISYTDTDGVVHPAAGGTVVNFFVIDAAGSSREYVIFNAGTIESPKTTVNGYAEATYSADNYGGMVKIYADVSNNTGNDLSDVSATTSFEVATGAPVSITVESIAPATINVVGSGKANRSLLTFSLTDSAGNPVPDLSPVAFTLSTPLGGGEKLAETEAATQGGRVFVSLIGGTVSGTVGVNASYYDAQTGDTISTEAKVTIVSGLPAAERLGMAVQYLNLAGGRTFGLHNDITAYLGDRYGNVVPDGTAVSFMSECGTIGTSEGFDYTTIRGVAHASLQTSVPTAPDLGGVDGSTLGNRGLCRIVAYTPGDEGFYDINGNNVYDEGIDVQTSDMSEPYIDANDNGVYDSGEKYIDVDGNGAFTPADGVYQSNTMIWKSVNVLMSDDQGPLNLTPKTFNIVDGGSQTFSYTLADIWGNSLVAGTTAKVTVTPQYSGGVLPIVSGDVDITVADSPGAGQQYFFTITMPADASGIISIKATVEVTPADGDVGANSDISVIDSALGKPIP